MDKKMVSYIQLQRSTFIDFTDYYPALSILYNYTQVLPTKMEVSITHNLEDNYLKKIQFSMIDTNKYI